MNLTRKQRNRVQELRRLGYTQVFFNRETGDLIPAYADWTLEYVLDEMELPDRYRRTWYAGRGGREASGSPDLFSSELLLRTAHDDLGQAYRDDKDDRPN